MFGRPSAPGWAIAVVTCLVLGSLGLLAVQFPSPVVPHVTHADGTSSRLISSLAGTPASQSATGLTRTLAVENVLRAKGISPSTVHLPNFAGAVPHTGDIIQPSYVQAPAPMGVADMGLRNVSGTLVPYELNTTSVEGTVNITNLQSLYLDGDGPDTFGIQLNSVVDGVTVFGNSSYEFWSQNYVDYTPSSQLLVFGDEVWNFSLYSTYFPANSVYAFSPNGTWYDFPALYQGYGPAITIAYPFTLTLYLNTSTIADRPALYFNYTVANATFHQSSSFDYLIFNSTVGRPTHPAPTPYYQADGYNYDPVDLPNDMELTLLGNGGGDIAAFTAADATMSLEYWNATAGAMQEVPSAFNAGSETGETSVGLAVYSSGGPTPIAIVRAGPSFLSGLWNYSGSSGAVPVTVNLRPANAFQFVNIGTTENASTAQWVPTSVAGTSTTSITATTVFYLPTGATYFLDFLMSDRDPTSRVDTATGPATYTIHLALDFAQGVYTPIFAMNDYELPPLASSGAGTAASPYLVHPSQFASIAPQFAQWDDWLFPVFPGLLIANTSAWVDVTPPSWEITLPPWLLTAADVTALGPNATIASLGLPGTNDLQIQFDDASNISLVNDAGISGWLASTLSGFPDSAVMLWNCTQALVASNTFLDQGNAMSLYGGTNNTIWGNTYLDTPVAATNPESLDDNGTWVTGVNDSESGDLIYNNYFAVPVPAVTPTYDPFLCGQYSECSYLAYNDTWNVSRQPASNYTVVDGWNLTGSIIGTSYQGGNYWSNYGLPSNPYGVLPYNDSGAITNQGDYVPLVPFSLYPITFQERGLPSLSVWNVTENGIFLSSSTATVGAQEPNGTYPLTVVGPSGYAAVAPPSNFTVSGAPVTVTITFAPLEVLSVNETGLTFDLDWSASVNGTGTGNVTLTSFNATSVIDFELIPGSYNVSAAAPGYTVQPVYTEVDLGTVSTNVSFAFLPIVGTLNLTVTPDTAAVFVDDHAEILNHGNWSSTFEPGLVSVEVDASGYYSYFTNATVTSNSTTTLVIALTAIPPGTLSLSVVPGSANVTVDGSTVTLSNGAYTGSWSPGVHAIVVIASGYYPYYNNVTVVSNTTTTVSISLNALSSSSSAVLGVNTTGWVIIAVLAALAVLFLVGMLYFRRRARPGGGPAPAQPWQESPPKNSTPPTS